MLERRSYHVIQAIPVPLSLQMAELGKKALTEGNGAKKRKLSVTTPKGAAPRKRQKLDSNSQSKQSKLVLKPNSAKKGQNSPKKGQNSPKKTVTPRKGGSPRKKPETPRKASPKKRMPKTVESSSESTSSDSSDEEEHISLAQLAKSPIKATAKPQMTLADLKKKMAQKLKDKQQVEKRKPGRPRKIVTEPPPPKRPRGRPRKEDSNSAKTGTAQKDSPKKRRSPNKKVGSGQQTQCVVVPTGNKEAVCRAFEKMADFVGHDADCAWRMLVGKLC